MARPPGGASRRSDQEVLFDRLVAHPALTGPEFTFLQARLARERGELEIAATLVQQCLASLPGHPEFRRFSGEINARLPRRGHSATASA